MSAGNDDNQNPNPENHDQPANAEPPKVAAPQLVPGEMEPRIESWMEMGPSPAIVPEPEAKPVAARKFAVRARRFTPLAAALTLAAALGGMVGSLAATSLVRVASAPAALPADDGVKHTIVRIENELAALRASIETTGTTTSAQFDRISERLARGERAQAEPASRLVKISDALERIERRGATQVVASASEPTGAVATRGVTPGPAVIDGWMIRRARNGIALIQGQRGIVEVETGDSLPGLGRIEEIKKRDGRWVVVTSRGIILER